MRGNYGLIAGLALGLRIVGHFRLLAALLLLQKHHVLLVYAILQLLFLFTKNVTLSLIVFRRLQMMHLPAELKRLSRVVHSVFSTLTLTVTVTLKLIIYSN